MSKAECVVQGLLKVPGLYYFTDIAGNSLIMEHMASGKLTGFYIPLTGEVSISNLNQKITITLVDGHIHVAGLIIQRNQSSGEIIAGMQFPTLKLSDGPKEHIKAMCKYLQSLA